MRLPNKCPVCGEKDICWLSLELKEFSEDFGEIYEIFECGRCGAWFKATYEFSSFNPLVEKKSLNPSEREDIHKRKKFRY